MNIRMKTIALAVGVALAQMAATGVRADSGVGVDTAIGNTLNPYTRSSAGFKDPDGLSEIENSRSPTGFLLVEPNIVREPTKTASGWLYTGSVEAGAIGVSGDKNNAIFKQYKDVDSGAYLNNFIVGADKPDTAMFVEALGGGTGYKDQYYGISFGRYNSWRFKGFYTETPHVFTTTYRNLWSGTGTGNLTLNSLTPGGTTNAATTDTNIGNAVLAAPDSELSLVRKKGGLRLDMTLTDQWKLFASYSNEKREGARPFGMVMGGGGGTGGVEIPESIDYNTQDFVGGLQYNDPLNSLNLQVSASLFRNNISTMTVENPMYLAAANGISSFPSATFDLYPDNDYFNLKGEYARDLPDFYKGRFTGVVSLSTMRQNDRLIPMTNASGATVNGVAGGMWDSLASLSKSSADAKIDTQLVDLGLALAPTNKLSVNGKLRYYKTKNHTEYWACNPMTGQWGRVLNDGSGSAMVNTPAYLDPSVRCNAAATAALGITPSAGNVNIRNVPYDLKQMNYTLAADYRLNRGNSINGSYERENFDYAYRERDQTWEDRFKLGYVNRSLEKGTLRLSLETDRRRGSTYNPDPYEAFTSASLGPLPTSGNVTSWIHVNDLHRKFDMADRDQDILSVRFNYALRDNLDGSLSLQFKDAKYPSSDYGRGKESQNSLNFDLNWQYSTAFSLYGFYSYQDAKMSQKGVQQNACVLGTTYYFFSDGSVSTSSTPPAGQSLIGTTTPTAADFMDSCGTASATSPLYPTGRAWTMDQKDHNDVVGIGLSYDFGKAKLDINDTYTKSRTSNRYSYNAAGLAMSATDQTLNGDGFEDMTFSQNVLDASLLIPLKKALSLRLIARYETGKIHDWHYDGVRNNPDPATNQQTYLDAGPQDYDATLVGVLVKLDF